MKRMEGHITLTFVFIVVLNLIWSSFCYKTFQEAIAFTVLQGLTYLTLIWIFSRQHVFLASLGAISLYILLILLFGSANSTKSSNFTWIDILGHLYGMVIALISLYQGNKLKRESKCVVTINVSLPENMGPDDVTITTSKNVRTKVTYQKKI